ncbi:MAG: tRNA lysidine(34) synthetase TilS [Clostridiales bacterium]|nr:tRNA lysidine(34) synthetase TilS [Clostridiales bacterium]
MSIDLELLETVSLSYQQIGAPQSILLALSGGTDSVVLLHLLIQLRREKGFDLSCVHINHGLREASDEEEKFVRNLTKQLDLPLYVKAIDVSRKGNLEEAARTARYAAIQQVQEQTQAEVVALAHHANDQAETILMHLMRGAGLAGFAGMVELRAPYWRPLLKIEKTQLMTYLQKHRLQQVEDESNFDTRILRNNIRHCLIPSLEDLAPGMVLRMSQTANILQAEHDFLQRLEDDWLSKHARINPPFIFLLRKPWQKQETAMKRRLVRSLCKTVCGELDYKQTERLVSFASGFAGSTLNLPMNTTAVLSKDRLHILRDDVKLTKLTWPQPDWQTAGDDLGDGQREQVVDAARVKGAAMRMVQKDDVIIPLGMKGTQSLRKYLSAKGVDRPFRFYWPVYARGNQVLWVPGCGVSEEASITLNTTSKVKLVFNSALPHEIDENGGKTP